MAVEDWLFLSEPDDSDVGDSRRVWETRDGEYLDPDRMSTEHIRNCVALLERKCKEIRRVRRSTPKKSDQRYRLDLQHEAQQEWIVIFEQILESRDGR